MDQLNRKEMMNWYNNIMNKASDELWKEVLASYPKKLISYKAFTGCQPGKINGKVWIFSKYHSHFNLKEALRLNPNLIRRYV
jgi:hypothetical protein